MLTITLLCQLFATMCGCHPHSAAHVAGLVTPCRDAPKSSELQQPQAQQQQQQPAFRNPFLPYEQELWVEHLSDSHTLLLNKFNVVPHHVLVVTRQYESQQDPLNSKDLAATQQVCRRGGIRLKTESEVKIQEL